MATLDARILGMYLGCRVQTPDGEGKLRGIKTDPLGKLDRLCVFFGRMVKTTNSIDDYKATRNSGDYLLAPEHYEAIATSDPDFTSFTLPGGVKPILRRLEDMTEEERVKEYFPTMGERDINGGEYTEDFETPQTFAWLLSKSFDLFNLIDSGLAIDSKTIVGGLTQGDSNTKEK